MPKYPAQQITWRDVHSSNIAAVGWDREQRMYVRFTNGGLYLYERVSRQRAVACAYARSVGRYLNQTIKPNYKAVKLA